VGGRLLEAWEWGPYTGMKKREEDVCIENDSFRRCELKGQGGEGKGNSREKPTESEMANLVHKGKGGGKIGKGTVNCAYGSGKKRR